MNVLQILPALHGGGVERGTLEIASALLGAGHKATVASSGGRLVAGLEAMGARHVVLPLGSKLPWQIWRNAHSLCTLIKQEQIDVLHVRSRAPAWSALLAARRCKMPLVTTFHGQYGHASALKRFYNSAMLRGDACIAVSDSIAQHIRDTYHTSSPITTIHRGIDLDYFDPARITDQQKRALRAKWQVDAQHPLLILPGRLTRLKGHHLLIDTLHLHPLPELQVRIVGDIEGRESYYRECLDYLQQHGLSEQIRFTGPCDDMAVAYAISDLVLSASTKPESFGRTICEAQAMGCRVIASDHGGARETLSPTQPQGLFAPRDTQALAQAIEKQLSLNAAQLKKQQATSRAHIEEHYSLQQMQTKTLAIYQSLCMKD